MFEKPRGGTEIMHEELMRRLPQEYKDKFSIFNYANQADLSKQLIYWNQLSYDQPGVQFLKNQENIDLIKKIVFVSHWQAEQFRKQFNIPGHKTEVMKNACVGVEFRQPGKREKVKLCYISTPWRGLDVLLDSWELLNPKNCELHVFSSCKIYGQDFANESEKYYQYLYNKCNKLSGVVYRGSIPNEELRKELPQFDILAYPNTFEETSCISIVEALSVGLRVVTSNIGALPETTEGWARMYTFMPNSDFHIKKFAYILSEEIDKIRSGELDEHLELQKRVYTPRWSWNKRIEEWKNFLDGL